MNGLGTQDTDFETSVSEHGQIGARLRHPLKGADLNTLLATLQGLQLVVRLRGMAGFVTDPGLAGRIRGAFGDVLAEGASADAYSGTPCRWQPQCAFEALFRKQGRMTRAVDFPSPWLIAVDGRKGDLIIRLSLYGMACDWMPAVAESFTMALKRVDWRGATGRFAPRLEIASRHLARITPAEERQIGNARNELELEFLSPLVVSNRNAMIDPASAFTMLGWRIEGIARWHELTLEGTDWQMVAQDLRRLSWEWLEVDKLSWVRGSKRQDRSIRMSGVLGKLRVSGPADMLAAFLPLFSAASLFHVGADVAFGCGRVIIAK